MRLARTHPPAAQPLLEIVERPAQPDAVDQQAADRFQDRERQAGVADQRDEAAFLRLFFQKSPVVQMRAGQIAEREIQD